MTILVAFAFCFFMTPCFYVMLSDLKLLLQTKRIKFNAIIIIYVKYLLACMDFGWLSLLAMNCFPPDTVEQLG